jgi:hypothetical protein
MTRVKAIFKKKIYRKSHWTIPIVLENDIWYTGQDLSYEKMTNPEKVTAEDRAKYPYIINPDNYYKIPNNRIFDMEDASDAAIYKLAIISGKMAKTKDDFNQSVHVGYFEDKAAEANSIVEKTTFEFKALEKAMNLSQNDIDGIILMLNYTTKKEDFNVDPKVASQNEKLAGLYSIAKKEPKIFLNCFEEYNPFVKEDLFIFKLIHNGLIKKSGPDYYESTNGIKGSYIGSTLNKVKDFINQKGQVSLKDKFAKLLNQIETGITVTIPMDIADANTNKEAKLGMLIAQIKSYLFDEDIEQASIGLSKLLSLVGKLDERYVELVSKYNKITLSKSESLDLTITDEELAIVKAKVSSMKETWETKTVEQLVNMAKIPTNVMKLDDMKDFIEDKEKIIAYFCDKQESSLIQKVLKSKK